MILPQLEQGSHGVGVVGMFFFDDNTYVLRAGDPLGERLAEVAEQQGIMLMRRAAPRRCRSPAAPTTPRSARADRRSQPATPHPRG